MPASLGMQGRPAQLRAGRGGGGGRPGEGYRWAQRGRSRAQRGARRGAAARSRREPPMAAASRMPAPPGGEKGPPLIGRAVLTHRRRSELCSALLCSAGMGRQRRRGSWGGVGTQRGSGAEKSRSQAELEGAGEKPERAAGARANLTRFHGWAKPPFAGGVAPGQACPLPFPPHLTQTSVRMGDLRNPPSAPWGWNKSPFKAPSNPSRSVILLPCRGSGPL